MRKLKQLAIDCNIHRERNIRPNDVDGTPECDYATCEYKCYEDPFDKYDYSTYDVFYSDDVIEKISPSIKSYFRFNGSGTLISIREYLDPKKKNHILRLKYIQMALAKMITSRTPIIDRFGYEVFIREDRGMYFLTNEFPIQTYVDVDQTMAYYGKTLIAEMATPFKKAVEKFEHKKMETVISKISEIPEDTPKYSRKIKEIVNEYPITSQSIVLEDAFLRKIKGEESKYIDVITKFFKNSVTEINEPVYDIKEKAKELAKKGRGRTKFAEEKSDKGKRPARKRKGELVYINTLYTQEDKGAKYGATTRWKEVRGKLRILKLSENTGWRDMAEYEQEVYSEKIRGKIKERFKHVEEAPVYGTIFGDGTFRVVAKFREKKRGKSDARAVFKGREKGYTKKEILENMWHAKAPLPPFIPFNLRRLKNNREFTDEEKAEAVVDALVERYKYNRRDIEKWSFDHLFFTFAYVDNKIGAKTLEETLKNHLIEQNLVIKAK